MLLLLSLFASFAASALSPCGVANLLRQAGFPEGVVPRMVCTAKYESTFNCGAVGTGNRDGTRDYGLYQVNSRYWCTGGPRSPARADCAMSCSQALDCTKNVQCALKVFKAQGLSAWYAYRSHKSECDRYRLPSECASAGNSVGVPTVPDDEPPVSSQLLGGPCTFDQQQGTCIATTTCTRQGGNAYASRLGATGCERIPSSTVQCCVTKNAALPADTPLCSYRGQAGVCIQRGQCASPKRPYSSNQGANGCGHIADPEVQCCAAPPREASVPPVAVPAGRACAIGYPIGCNSLRGVNMLFNVQFADELIRINAHARNTNTRLNVIESFRSASSVVVGAADARQRVGFAIRMTPATCDIDCLCKDTVDLIQDDSAKRFLEAVMADSTLRWAGDPAVPSNVIDSSMIVTDDNGEQLVLPPASGCVRDVAYFESTTYEASANFEETATCLNAELTSGSKKAFNCASGASLLNDDAALGDLTTSEFGDDEQLDALAASGSATTTTLAAGAIAGIAIAACCVVLLVAGVVALLVLRSKAGANDAMIMTNATYNNTTMFSARDDVVQPRSTRDAVTSARSTREQSPVATMPRQQSSPPAAAAAAVAPTVGVVAGQTLARNHANNSARNALY